MVTNIKIIVINCLGRIFLHSSCWPSSNSPQSCSIYFILEAAIKIIGLGFVTEKRTYIRDAWNVLDFIVVLIGWLGFIPGMANLTALRTIRVLRPLKSIKSVREIKVLVNSLLQSLPALANVIVFLIFIYIVFGIICVSLLQGLLYSRCRY